MAIRPLSFFLTTAMLAGQLLHAQTDPGPRSGPPSSGKPLQGLSANDIAYFNEGAKRFSEVDSVSGAQPGAPGVGLGPRFNMNSCAGCHAHPSVGGTSPAVNPLIAVATEFGARNVVPQFLQQNGPVRVVRFARNPDGSPDGGVQGLFVVTGRSDAPGCSIAQPSFDAALAANNASFRIPTPVFGGGLIEAITDSAILANLRADMPQKSQLGIHGRENRNANDGSITRFGWKAQNKSLLMFAGEAYNVEQGVTNDLFPTERDETPGCGARGTPEDHTDTTTSSPTAAFSDLVGFTYFMRFLAPPDPVSPANTSAQNGRQVFSQIGCAYCHHPAFQTGTCYTPALNQKPVPLYSDLLLHNMGSGLADSISQGQAGGNDWRTAPLWGLGQRLFFLHDGRASDLVTAIHQHNSPGSEATQVINAYDALQAQAKQDLLNFLRSL